MVDIRYDAPYIPAFTTGLIQLAESGRYEGKENIPLPYYRRPQRKLSEKPSCEESPKDTDRQIDLLA